MNTITKYVVLLILCLSAAQLNAQEVANDSIAKQQAAIKEAHIKSMEEKKEKIKNQERENLKKEIENINKLLENGEISASKAEKLKREAAKERAATIEYRLALVNAKIDFIRNASYDPEKFDYRDFYESSDYEGSIFKFGEIITIGSNEWKRKTRKYDKRTTSDLVFAIGFNNAIGKNQTIGDAYNFLESGFVELGWAWKTRLFEDSNAVRLKYGFSFQWNKLTPKGDRYFVQDGNVTTLQEFPGDLKEAEFRISNLVFPVHFEFGPSRKIERDTYFRYSTRKQFKIGVGGYAGFRMGTQQKLRFEEDNDRVKQKIRRNYNASNFVYGLSAYVGLGNTSLYAKHDLKPLFKDQAFDQNNLSLGVRFDFD